jgi:glycosyltransferase involved in cell wall biosynthesis
MRIVQITPGAGGMFCGNCFRDNALVAALRKMGHDTLMVPLYLPMRLEEDDQSAGTPIFFSGINVYLQEKSPLFRTAPKWLHDLLASPTLLKWAAGRSAKTRAEDLGGLTISMLRGEEGNQSRELDELITWLKDQERPDVICLSNALLIGLVRRLKTTLRVPIVCFLQGEDAFLDALPEEARTRAWEVLSARAAEVDLFIAPSRYFADLMQQRLGLPDERVSVIYNGINLEGFSPASSPPDPPVLGYFARMCREKGLEQLVDAFILLRQRGTVPTLRLLVGGGCGPSDEPFVNSLRARLRRARLEKDAEFHPNVSRAGKLEFLRSLSVFSVPALYGEAFGLYVIEALAAGVPVVQPRHAAFPEIVDATEGGLICDPGDPKALATAIETLLRDPVLRGSFADKGRKAALREFGIETFANRLVQEYEKVSLAPASGPTT